MKKLCSRLLAIGLGLASFTVLPIVQPTWAQTQNSQAEELKKLLQQALQQTQQGQPQQAIATYQQALALARQLGDRETEATALVRIGLNYDNTGQRQPALNFYNQALSIFKAIGDRSGVAVTLNNIGTVYDNIGQGQKALAYYNQALPILREVGDRSVEATTLNNIGFAYDAIGQLQKALEFYNQALPIRREVGDLSGEAMTLNNIGSVYHATGQPQKALEFYNQALSISREVSDLSGEAITLNNIGSVYDATGQPQKALEFYNQVLSISTAVGARPEEALALSNIGAVYEEIGQPHKALAYYNQALPISREVGDRLQEAVTLNNIGLVYNTFGQLQKALAYYNQALPILREIHNRSLEATTLTNIGAVYDTFGQLQKALAYYNQALPILREVGDRSQEANTLNNIGFVYRTNGQPQKALEFYNQALSISRKIGNRSREAMTLNNISYVYEYTNQPTEAIKNLEQSVEITLEIRGGLQRGNRQNFLEQERGNAVALVNLLIKEEQPERAYEWVNLTTTADLADYSRLIDAKVANSEAQQAIEQWNQTNRRLENLRQELQEKFSPELSQQINELQTEVNQQAETISRRFPEVAELFETKPQDIAQLRANLPTGNVVIQPVLLTNVSNVPNAIAIFVFTKDKLTVTKIVIDPEEFDTLVTRYRRQVQTENSQAYKATSKKLYDILIRPVENEIQAESPKQLSIIATDKLRYIPFETLIDSTTGKYLIEKYPVNNLTRLSSRSFQQQPNRKATVLALGNPFPQDSNRKLDGAEVEVKSIAPILPGSEGYLGNKATLSTFRNQAPRFPILHLATHGCFRPQGCPNLRMEANTMLFSDRNFNIADTALLGLKNTNLVVLSACQTAIQANSNGEEFAGIAYLFERAGANAVIATLWSVADKETKDLMIKFYQNLKKGMTKGEALRQAKISLLELHPYYWSPFILIGDAR